MKEKGCLRSLVVVTRGVVSLEISMWSAGCRLLRSRVLMGPCTVPKEEDFYSMKSAKSI